MATPHVAGAAALVLSMGYQTVATLKSTILNSVDLVASLAGLVRTGGWLDVCRALPRCGTSAPITLSFSLGVSPSRQAVSRGEAPTYTVSLSAARRVHRLDDLSISGLPSGATASFAPSAVPLLGSATATLAVTTTSATEPGNYTLTVSGAG